MIDNDQVCLILFNMQVGLIPLLHNTTQVTHDSVWLADLFATHRLPRIIIEHKKLGAVLPALKEVANDHLLLEKFHFSLTKEQHIMQSIEALGKKQLVLAGAESHICLFQSAIGLMDAGYEVFVVSDAISARSESDNEAAKARLQKHGCELVTKEMLFFELIDNSELPNYLELSLKFLDGRYIR